MKYKIFLTRVQSLEEVEIQPNADGRILNGVAVTAAVNQYDKNHPGHGHSKGWLREHARVQREVDQRLKFIEEGN